MRFAQRKAPALRAAAPAALATGALLWCASPAVGAGWLAWVAVVPAAYVALTRAGTRTGRLVVPLAYAIQLELLLIPALPFGLADGQWAKPPLPVLIGDSPVLLVALVVVPLFAALLHALRFGSPSAGGSWAVVLVPAAAWTALDFVRVAVDPGAFWGPLHMSMGDRPEAAIASLAGPWLLTFTVVATNYAIALALVRRRPAPALGAAAGVAVLIGAAALAGALRAQPGAPLRVAAIQPGYDTAEDDRRELRWFEPGTYDRAALDLIEDLGEQTRQATAQGARLVVWPEAAIWVDLREEPHVRAELASLARRAGATLVVPFFHRDERRSYVVAVSPAGAFGPARPKRRPMWYLGERRPSGAEPGTLEAGATEVGALLGVDTGGAALPAGLVADGAGVIASSTHDWEQLAVQQRALARLHSAAAAAPVVRADWRYGSAIVDVDGSVVADAGTDKRRTVLVADVLPARAATPYAHVGDVFAWLCAAGWIAALVGGALAGRASRYRPRPALAPLPTRHDRL